MELDNQQGLDKEEKVKKKKIALLIDGDNISYKYIPTIISQCQSFGKIKIKRFYGDITKINSKLLNTLNLCKVKFKENNINTISGKTQKNSTDYIFMNDVGKILKKKNIEIFCIATSDSDFIGMIESLKKSGKLVYVFGQNNSAQSLIDSCNEFFHIETLIHSQNGIQDDDTNKFMQEFYSKCLEFERYFSIIADNLQSITKQQKDILSKLSKSNTTETITNNANDEIKNLIIETIKEETQNGWANMSKVLTTIRNKKSNFSYKPYANHWGKFLATFPELVIQKDKVKIK